MLWFQGRGAAELSCRKADTAAATHTAPDQAYTTANETYTTADQTYILAETEVNRFRISDCGYRKGLERQPRACDEKSR